jgi:hypothetical protein
VAETALLRIVDWSVHYENNRTRDLKRMEWVPIPNKMDGDGYTALMEHPNGCTHLGAWLALVQIASKCKVRGTLIRDDGSPHDARSLSRISRIPAPIFEEAIPRFINDLHWLEGIPQEGAGMSQAPAGIPQEGAGMSQAPAGIPQEGAGMSQEGAPSRAPRRACDEGKGREGKGREGNGTEPTARPTEQPIEPFDAYWQIFEEAGKALNEVDKRKALAIFISLDSDTQQAAFNDARTKSQDGTWPDARLTPMPFNHLVGASWTRISKPRTLPMARASPDIDYPDGRKQIAELTRKRA